VETFRSRPRLFLDCNVITGGISAERELDKAVMSMFAASICRLVLADVVRREVEPNLLRYVTQSVEPTSSRLLRDYDRLLKLTRPEIVPPPAEEEVLSGAPLTPRS